MNDWLAKTRSLLMAGCLLCAVNGQVARGQSFERLPAATTQATWASHSLRRLQSDQPPPEAEVLPPVEPDGFPPLPPDPYESESSPLPPLETELWNHGGSYLYAPEGDRLNWPHDDGAHYQMLRLPEDWVEPKPVTLFSEFQGTGPIMADPRLKWPGPNGYAWEPRFVGYGSLEVFAFALEQNNRRQDVIGTQLRLDLDLALTSTERFHVQHRPLGRENTGGSYYQFSNPEGYVDNSTATPDRYWFEGELHSIFGAYLDPFQALDYNIVAGKFPFMLHNSLLMNDEFLGVVLSKNTIYAGNLSNLNVQAFYGFNDVDAFGPSNGQVLGTHLSIDYRKRFYEATYAFAQHDFDSSRDSNFAAVSGTQFFGPLAFTARGLFKWGDEGGRGDGQLLVVESNYTRAFHENAFHFEQGVFFCNAFYQSRGWNSISGGNLNRLRTAFEINPLVRIAAGGLPAENLGIALGVQLFRHHQDESFVPEIAFESPDGTPVAGLGLRYLRKTGSRSYFDVLASFTFSDDPRFDREGVFTSYTIVF